MPSAGRDRRVTCRAQRVCYNADRRQPGKGGEGEEGDGGDAEGVCEAPKLRPMRSEKFDVGTDFESKGRLVYRARIYDVTV